MTQSTWTCAIVPLGDCALTVTCTTSANTLARDVVRCLGEPFQHALPHGVTAVVPAIDSITLHYDPALVTFRALSRTIEIAAAELVLQAPETRSPVVIPVCYAAEFAPDLATVAALHGISEDTLIEQHTAAEYTVAMIGFLPGFPYLDGLPSALATPRRNAPRTRVAAGSVGIGGTSTGVYPFDSPGGWHLIGKTPRVMFDATRDQPSLLRAGDTVQFVAISAHEFSRWTEPR
jgi:inhibitor of KinA